MTSGVLRLRVIQFRDHNESLTARVTLCSPTDAATFDTILDNSISWCRRNDIQSDID
ncbi:uncharacterized protein DT104_18221 [Salmonella enterica subsp. enterica serovar Typhimurium str. DT104]|uniref:Uncharacterized protein n=1 Tax=Salmonella typhimurium (strain D23580) TaxID=568708 RepID=A0A6C7IE73_SALTD|nr:hypothetical protein STMMW_18461 [Salmonella enterica subsp. enterica serovar Typhimurium str. D23580]CCW74530.1 uncharacterized protein DT104_18221 [Salmonella enterica subsp. enterica serovar Typhimurium str. DT104]